jgi:hypothetical protein
MRSGKRNIGKAKKMDDTRKGGGCVMPLLLAISLVLKHTINLNKCYALFS